MNRANDAAPAFELAFEVIGTWDDPFPRFDTQTLLERSPSAGPLLEAIKKRNAPPVPAIVEQAIGGSNSGAAAVAPPAAPVTTEPVSTAPAQSQQ